MGGGGPANTVPVAQDIMGDFRSGNWQEGLQDFSAPFNGDPAGGGANPPVSTGTTSVFSDSNTNASGVGSPGYGDIGSRIGANGNLVIGSASGPGQAMPTGGGTVQPLSGQIGMGGTGAGPPTQPLGGLQNGPWGTMSGNVEPVTSSTTQLGQGSGQVAPPSWGGYGTPGAQQSSPFGQQNMMQQIIQMLMQRGGG